MEQNRPCLRIVLMVALWAYVVGLIVTNTQNVDLTHEQYIIENVLAEDCPAVGTAIPWVQLERKLETCRRHEFYDPLADACRLCPAPTPTDRVFAVYWESQANCARLVNETSTRYVTHVYWAFATVGPDGQVAQSLQYWDDGAVLNCMAELRMRCIKQVVSIGGADCRANFFALKSAAAMDNFISSALAVVKKFGFDGIDIDDETGNMAQANFDWKKNQGPVVAQYLTKLRQGLRRLLVGGCYHGPGMDQMQAPGEPRYLLSWDEFPSSFDRPLGPCFDPEITPLVDWVNIMLYNLPSPEDYAETMNHRIPNWWVPVIPAAKLVIGACSGLGCVEPIPPAQQAYAAAYNGSVLYRGCMLWSATFDILYEKASAMNIMGAAGNYGVKLPFYALDL
uniref:Secreted protein n=1 Tax=Achlya hypogyna TaxID=1202772 RepID=A0A0A7CNH6_ACHHY|nr:secreted protein [Achlya hypogyna]